MMMRMILLALVGSGMVWQALVPGLIGAQPIMLPQLDAKAVRWTGLSYRAKNLWVDVTTDVHLTSSSEAEVQTALIQNRQGSAIQIPAAGAYRLINHTIIDSIFQSPVKIENQTWFDPQDVTVFGRNRLRRGDDDFEKVYRFTQEGVFRHRREPQDQQEARQAPEKWTDVRDTFYSYDLARLGCPNVSERLTLIYIVSAIGRLEDDKPYLFCIFGKRQLFQVALKSAGLHEVETDYTIDQRGSKHHRQGDISAQAIELEARPFKSDLEETENFSFLGLHKNIVFYMEPASNLPVQISGEIRTAGQATLKLHTVQLK